MARRATGWVLAAAMMIAGASAGAQQIGSDAEAFLGAIRKADAGKMIEIETRQGASVVNYRGYSGDTPLTVAMAARNTGFAGYLLTHGATADLADKRGDTPLIVAARGDFSEGVDLMLGQGANVNAANRQGETALIVAVQGRHPRIVKRLMEFGANPDKADFAAGFSAREYAKRDNRNPELSRLIETTKPAKR